MRRLSRKSATTLAWCFTLLLGIISFQVKADVEDLSKETAACLKCHNKADQVKKLSNGETLSLVISAEKFAASMHKETECEDCHSDIDAKNHGKVKKDVSSTRQYAFDMRESCRECHKKNFKSYEDGLHAALVKEGHKEGRKDAPLCSDCHNPHTQPSVKLIAPLADTPCAKCHEAIFKAYSDDVHGKERVIKGKDAPICADCHKAHDIQAASLGNAVKDACLNCHENAVQQHKDWLPNTLRHFEAISCPVCHAPTAQRRVNLRLYDIASGQQVAEKVGVPQFEKRAMAADASNTGLDERALWSLLKEFSQSEKTNTTVLRGRLEVRSGVQAHQLSEKSQAIKDCDTCHRAGAEAFQSVTLTIAGPDGRPIRHGVRKDVLTSLLATESVRGFYAIGSTRIKWLDILLVLVVIGAASVPLGHMTVRRLFKNYRDRRETERLSALSSDAQNDAGQ